MPKQILILEDNEELLQQYVEQLPERLAVSDVLLSRRIKVEFTFTITGGEADAYLRKMKFDLAILDIMTPEGMHMGMNIAREIDRHNQGYFSRPEIIIVSAAGNMNNIMEAGLRGAKFLVKPCSMDRLVKEIEDVLAGFSQRVVRPIA